MAPKQLMVRYLGEAQGRVLGPVIDRQGRVDLAHEYHFRLSDGNELPLAPEDREFFETYPGDEFQVEEVAR